MPRPTTAQAMRSVRWPFLSTCLYQIIGFFLFICAADAMIGDVNLFLTDPHDRTLAEVEVMIAEPGHRGKGLGRQAAKLIMKYGQ